LGLAALIAERVIFYLVLSKDKIDTEQILLITICMKIQFIPQREDRGFNCKQKYVNAVKFVTDDPGSNPDQEMLGRETGTITNVRTFSKRNAALYTIYCYDMQVWTARLSE
jgi:hypothetical protein